MDKMDRFLKNWDLMRIVRLLAGVGIAVYAISSKDYTFLLLAGLFLFQAIMNISCCGSGGCYTRKDKPKENIYRDQIKKYKPD